MRGENRGRISAMRMRQTSFFMEDFAEVNDESIWKKRIFQI
jgi:hypothetical protein